MTREELLKIAKPVLFNTQMVIAILEGRNTVTRRVVKPQPDEKHNFPLGFVIDSTNKKDIGKFAFGIDEFGGSHQYAKPPCKKGDYLYVRETWSEWTGGYLYKAWPGPFHQPGQSSIMRWYPSIHMPKEAARIFLKVTDVRVERLQDITDAEAEKEGVTPNNPLVFPPDKWPNKENFKIIWNSTIKTADLDKYRWEANPWVWVIEFERVEVQESNKPKQYILVSQGIEIYRTTDKEEAECIMNESNAKYYEYLQRCADEGERPADNMVYMHVEE